MQAAAVGIRPHSGWAALVVVSGVPGAIEVIDRRRIVITASNIQGATQPYHHAKDLSLPDAERHLARCAASSEGLALEALRHAIDHARGHAKAVVGCAILLASGRNLPALPQILASHPLIHTAEGEFFRESLRRACQRLKMQVTGVRERDLDERAQAVFGARADSLKIEIAGLGKTVGPPWTTDQKNACLAALLVSSDLRSSAANNY
jgi:hypothetical protein